MSLTTRVVVASLALVVGLATSAMGQEGNLPGKGVAVGPARQLVEPGQDTAVVYVSNPGTKPVRVIGNAMVHTEATGWTAAGGTVDMFLEPRKFKLQPGEQREVRVFLPETTEKCSLMGAQYRVKVRENNDVTVRAAAIAQFAVNGPGGTEQDCLAVLPSVTPAPSTTASGSLPNVGNYWWIVLLLAGAYGVYRTGSRVQARKYRKKVGSGFE